MNVAQDSDKWQAVVKVVMNLQVQNKLGISGLTEELLASQEGLCSTELVNLLAPEFHIQILAHPLCKM